MKVKEFIMKMCKISDDELFDEILKNYIKPISNIRTPNYLDYEITLSKATLLNRIRENKAIEEMKNHRDFNVIKDAIIYFSLFMRYNIKGVEKDNVPKKVK